LQVPNADNCQQTQYFFFIGLQHREGRAPLCWARPLLLYEPLAKQSKAKQSKAKQSKAKQSKAKQSKAKQSKTD
jgi:hypothetical protein